MKRFFSILLILILLLSSLTGCSSNEVTYLSCYEDLTPAEYDLLLYEVFSTLIPSTETYVDYGLSRFSATYAYYESPDLPDDATIRGYDELIVSQDATSGVIYYSSMPVFYGILVESMKFEELNQIDNSDLAEKYSKKFAIKASSVEETLKQLLRQEVSVSHFSLLGAEYIIEDEVYVFDALENPYQSYKDDGLEMAICLDVYDSSELADIESVTWENALNTPTFTQGIPLWYDKNGGVYNMYGEYMFTQDDPNFRAEFYSYSKFLIENDYMSYPGQTIIACISFENLFPDIDKSVTQYVEKETYLCVNIGQILSIYS